MKEEGRDKEDVNDADNEELDDDDDDDDEVYTDGEDNDFDDQDARDDDVSVIDRAILGRNAPLLFNRRPQRDLETRLKWIIIVYERKTL